MIVTVVIPGTPPAECSPNSHKHWRVKHRANAAMRETAGKAGIVARMEAIGNCGGGPVFDGPVVVRTVIAWEKGRKRCDNDNAGAMCKGLYDGALQDAGIVANDKHCTFLPVEQIRDKAGVGYVTLEVSA